MTRNDNRINLEMRYEAWKKSGLGVADWCRNRDVKGRRMYYRTQKLRVRKILLNGLKPHDSIRRSS